MNTNFNETIQAMKDNEKIRNLFITLVKRGWDVDARAYLMEKTGATEETARLINDLANCGELEYEFK